MTLPSAPAVQVGVQLWEGPRPPAPLHKSPACAPSHTPFFHPGSIIRCMRRLEELLRQMCQAAKAIGNTELENKFAEGQCPVQAPSTGQAVSTALGRLRSAP